MAVLLLGGLGLALGLLAGLLFGPGGRRVAVLLAAGVVLALAYFAIGWAIAPASAEEAGDGCSDCGYWLGRYWEAGLVLSVGVLNLLGWAVGVVAGAAMRLRSAPARGRTAS
jgi:hypothetical protein